MNVTVEINGVVIVHHSVHVEHCGTSTAFGTFTLDPSISVANGDTITIEYESKVLASGTVGSVWSGSATTTGTFMSPRSYQQALRAEDQAIIDEFLIDSFARGWAHEAGVVLRD